jgi:hypothetical protein
LFAKDINNDAMAAARLLEPASWECHSLSMTKLFHALIERSSIMPFPVTAIADKAP